MSLLTKLRAITNLSELYTRYTEYRLGVFKEQIRAKLKEGREKEGIGKASV